MGGDLKITDNGKPSSVRWTQAMDNLKAWREQNECPENIAKWRVVHDEVASWLSAYAEKGKLLDVGCKTGELKRSSLFPSTVEYFGIDPLQISEFNYDFPFRCETLESTSFGDEMFDFLLIKDSIDYFEEPDFALLSAFRILKKGGRLLISEGGHQTEYGRGRLTGTLLYMLRIGRKLLSEGPRGPLSSAVRRLKKGDWAHAPSLSVDVRDTYPNGDLSATYILDCCVRAGFSEAESRLEGHRLFVSAIR